MDSAAATYGLNFSASPLMRRILHHQVVRQVSQMILTRGIGLVLAAAGSIWAARCLGPDNLGISGMILAIVAPMGLLVDLNQNVALIREYKRHSADQERSSLIASVFIFRWFLCLTSMLVAALFLTFHGLPSQEWHLAVIAGFPLLLCTVNQSAWVLQGQERVPAQYLAILAQSLVGSTSYFLFFRPGQMSAGSDILVMAAAVSCEFAVGWAFAVWPMVGEARSPWNAFRENIRGILPHCRRAMSLYWSGRWLAVSGLVSYVYVFLQMPLVGSLLGTAALGQYRTAATLVNGFQAFAIMVPALLYPRMIEWNKRGADYLWMKQWELVRGALVFMVPLCLAAFLFSPAIYKTLYGSAFLPAAKPFAILLTSKMLIVLNGIFGWGLWAQNRDRTMLMITTVAAAISLALNVILIPRAGLAGAATVTAIAESLVLTGTILASYRALRTSPSEAAITS